MTFGEFEENIDPFDSADRAGKTIHKRLSLVFPRLRINSLLRFIVMHKLLLLVISLYYSIDK